LRKGILKVQKTKGNTSKKFTKKIWN